MMDPSQQDGRPPADPGPFVGFLADRLSEREGLGSLRRLSVPSGDLIDLCSNDYLGIQRSGVISQALARSRSKPGAGATGSRLLSGNSRFTENLEERIASYHGADSGLIFNSGYDANLGVWSVIPVSGDTIIYDELVHASIRDGIRLSRATSFPFRHNDLDHLQARLGVATGHTYVAVESIYSMDGDLAPLVELVQMCEEHGAHVIVDEAHATGILGIKGRGLVVAAALEERVLARVHTFGKALGCHGAVVLGSNTVRELLVNFARSFIYTTALPEHSLRAIEYAYDEFPGMVEQRKKLRGLSAHFVSKKEQSGCEFTSGTGPIQGVVIPGNAEARAMAAAIAEKGLDARPILSPTVQRGQERLRICLHAFNTYAEIDRLFEVLP